MIGKTRPADEPQAVLREGTALLQAFLTSDTPYAISNRSMLLLVDTFAERLTQATAKGRGLAVVRLWRRHLPEAKAAAFAQAPYLLSVNDGPLRLFREGEARRIAAFCPDAPDFRTADER